MYPVKMKKISLVVPFFNEQEILRQKVPIIHKFCKIHFKKFEIFFVNDGSNDLSKEIVELYVRQFPNLHIISYNKNLGRGEAIRRGFKQSKGDYVGYIDCDLEIKLSYILVAVKQLATYDIVIASKFIPGSEINTLFLRKVSSIFYNILARVVLGSNVTDHQAGLKFFRKKAIANLLPKTYEKGWLWDTEVLYIAQKKNYTILELPIKISYGYRKIRSSFFLDFLKLPIVLVSLKNKVNKTSCHKKRKKF